MPCYHPLDAWMRQGGGKPKFYKRNGPRESGPDWQRDLKLPCGRCIGCRLERSKQWALRLMHEAQLHKENSFITLTYNNDSRHGSAGPDGPAAATQVLDSADIPLTTLSRAGNAREDSLSKKDLARFCRRLYKSVKARNPAIKVRYYAVGEYGDKNKRPHYHAAIFGEAFYDDRYEWRTSPSGNILYRSSRLEALWPHGNCEIGDLTFESAAYIARYIMKKITGTKADEHYERFDPLTGERYWITPEFNVMSRRPGIGKEWWNRYSGDVLTTDSVTYAGIKHKPPRYYDNQVVAQSPFKADLIKLVRELRAATKEADNTPARLAAKEAVAIARLNMKKRPLE